MTAAAVAAAAVRLGAPMPVSSRWVRPLSRWPDRFHPMQMNARWNEAE